MIENIALYTVVYGLFSICIIFPPTEFLSAGLTLEKIFSGLLGDEQIHFVHYHLRRTCLITFLHSCLPLGYFAFLEFLEEGLSIFGVYTSLPLYWRILFGVSIIFPITAATLIAYWRQNDYANHPTVQVLKIYSPNWREVASTIDTEYRRVDKFAVNLGGIRRVIVTDSWVLLISSYRLELSQQADVRLTVTGADHHDISHHSETQVQFLNIKVENTAKPVAPFTLRYSLFSFSGTVIVIKTGSKPSKYLSSTSSERFNWRIFGDCCDSRNVPKMLTITIFMVCYLFLLNSLNYRDLKAKLSRPVSEARDVIVHQSLDEQFVQAFEEHANNNPRAELPQHEKDVLDNCLGCGLIVSNVKLEKQCLDRAELVRDEEGREIPNCRQCYCRPMWCVSCMGRWFAARQDPHHPERWLGGKSPCPTCRATFCVLDVSLVE